MKRLLFLFLFVAVPLWAQNAGNSFATQTSPQGKLVVQVIGGSIMFQGVVVSVPTQNVTVPNLSTSYIQFNGTNIIVNQTGWVTGDLPISVVNTNQTDIISINDGRPQWILSNGAGGGGSSPGGNNNDIQVKNGTLFGSGVTLTANVGTAGNIAVKYYAGDAVQYVSNSGNDSFDGLSAGTAKLTVAAACTALGGNAACTSGTGTIYIAPGFSGTIPPVRLGDPTTFTESHLNDDNAQLSLLETIGLFGPNPWVDSNLHGMRAVSSVPQTTANCSASTSVAFTSVTGFQVGDGVRLSACGPTNTMLTPAAPGVTPVLQAGPDRADRSTAPAGSTTYTYTIVARDRNGGMTAAGSSGSTTTGVSTLGTQSVTVSTIARANNIDTVVTSSAINCSPNAAVFITGSSDASFSGLKMIASCNGASVPLSTTLFTYLDGNDTRGGCIPINTTGGCSTNAATGGTAQVYNGNYINWATVTGATQYYVCKSGSSNPIGETYSSETFWLDIGQAPPTFPDFVAGACSAAATNDYLATTITGISGNTVTVANAASQNVNNIEAIFDDAPTFANTYAACVTALSTRSTCHISAATTGTNYVFNSALALGGTVPVHIIQASPIVLNETISDTNAQMTWTGILAGNQSNTAGNPAFPWGIGQNIVVNGAYPGISIGAAASTFDHLNFNIPKEGVGLMFSGAGNFNYIIEESNFLIAGTDQTGQAVVSLGTANHHYIDVSFSTNNSSAFGYTVFPVITFRSDVGGSNPSGDIVCEHCFFVGRGFGDDTPGAGAQARFEFNGAYAQALRVPLIEMGSVSNPSVTIRGFTNDTSSAAAVANMNPNPYNTMQLLLENVENSQNEAHGAPGIITGNPVFGVVEINGGALLGQNVNIGATNQDVLMDLPTYGVNYTALQLFNEPVSMDPSHTFFFPLASPTNLVETPGATGSMAAATNTFQVTAQDSLGGETVGSNTATCITDSTHKSCAGTWNAVPGATCYNVYWDNLTKIGSCVTTTSFTMSANSCCNNGAPVVTGASTVALSSTQIVTPQITLVGTQSPIASTCTITQAANSCPGGSGFTAGGDLSGSSSSQTVIGLRGLQLPTLAATSGLFLDTSGALSLTTALPNGTTATTQALNDNTTSVATDAFVEANSISNPFTAIGDTMYGGAGGAITRLAGPTGPNGIPQQLVDTPSAGAATAENWGIPGVPIDAQTGTTFTVPITDDVAFITGNNGAATAWSGFALANNYTFSFENLGVGLITYTPNSGTVNGSATQIIPTKWFGFHYTDNSNTFMPVMPTIGAFPNCIDSGGNHLNFTASTGALSCGSTGGGGSSVWSSLTNPSGNLSLTMAANTSIFNTTTAEAQMFAWKNTTAATVGTSQGSPVNAVCGRAWTGSDVEDCMTFGELPGNGVNAPITFTIGHTGSSTGAVTLQVPTNIQSLGSTTLIISSQSGSVQLNAGGGGSVNIGLGKFAVTQNTGQVSIYGNISTVGKGVISELYNTASTNQTASIGSTTMITNAASDQNYRFSAYVGQLNAGTSCSGSGSIGVNLIYTDPVTGTAYTAILIPQVSNVTTIAATIPLTSGALGVGNTGSFIYQFRSKASTTISYSTTYTAGSGCATGQAYSIYPVLESQ